MPELNITAIVETFAIQIAAAVEASMVNRLQAAIAAAFGAPQKRGPGRPPKKAVASVAPVAARSAGKKTRPKQLCPVPGCKNVAAPIFGMVCKDHKNVAKRARKLQGQYLGALKSLAGADRAKVKAVAKDKGVAEAVKLALGMKKA
jgi:hypothetical protein